MRIGGIQMFHERNGWGIHTKRKILGTLENTPAKPAAVSETAQKTEHMRL